MITSALAVSICILDSSNPALASLALLVSDSLPCASARVFALPQLIIFAAHFIVRLIPHMGVCAHEVAQLEDFGEAFSFHGARVGVQSGDKDHSAVTKFVDELKGTLQELPSDAYQTGLADLHSRKLDVRKANSWCYVEIQML